jgi:uncharacterized protein YecT (DUF1311 family)
MKQLRTLLLFLLLIQSLLTIAQTQDKTSPDEETKAAINAYKLADAELNSVFNQILTMYSSDTEFLKNLRESQALWVKFRTAELKTKFPARGPGEYGSVYTMCVNDFLTEMTNQRVTTLKEWIKGTYEGDVCSGSVKIN